MFGPPVEVEMSIGIGAPPEVVWTYLVDWEHLDRWMQEGKEFRVTSPMSEGVGVTAEAEISIGGITTTDAIRVSGWKPPEELEIEHLGWVAGRGIMICRPAPWGTFLYWKETLEPPLGILGAIGIRLFRPLMLRVFQRDLKTLKELVEAERRER